MKVGKINDVKYIFITALMAIFLTLVATMPVGAADNPSTVVYIENVTVTGAVGTSMSKDIKIYTLAGDGFVAIPGVIIDAESWFGSNIPDGLTAKIKSVTDNNQVLTITISGTPNVSSGDYINIKVPYGFINGMSSGEITVDQNINAKWNILYKVTFAASPTAGGTVTATKNGVAFTSGSTATTEEPIIFTAKPNNGYKVKEWKHNGAGLGSDALSFTGNMLDSNSDIIVEFEKIPYYEILELEENGIKSLAADKRKIKINGDVTLQPVVLIKAPENNSIIDTDPDNPHVTYGEYEITVTSSNTNIASVTYTYASGIEIKAVAKNASSGSTTITIKIENEAPYIAKSFTTSFVVEIEEPIMAFSVDNLTLNASVDYDPDNPGSDVSKEIEINFETEEISVSAPDSIYAYSTNGTAWTAFAKPVGNTAVDISAILDKTGKTNVKFTNKELTSSGKPDASADIWTIGPIANRPTAPNVKVVYGTGSGKSGDTEAGCWTISGVNLDTSLLFATSSNGKVPDEEDSIEKTFGFKSFPPSDPEDVRVKELPENGKVAKFNYLFKLAPVVSVETNKLTTAPKPSSKIAKIKVSSELKAPKGKVNYKKETVDIKKGLEYYIGSQGVTNYSGLTFIKQNQKITLKFENIFSEAEYYENKLTKTADSNKSVYIRIAPTGKKPGSGVTEIKVKTFKKFSGDPKAGHDKVKYKYKLPKGLEVWDAAKGKWTSSIKITGNTNIWVRDKGSAKYNVKFTDNQMSGETASVAQEWSILWGNYTDDKGNTKQGVLNVTIKP